MKTTYDSIYLAPHLDDAVLSCGGQIFEETRRGQAVLVVTVMAGDPPPNVSGYAQSLHSRWELPEETATARRREDLAACALLGADALHWPVPDCIYRTAPANGTPMYLSDEDIFGEIHPADAPLVKELTGRLAALPPANRIVAPLTVGHHVDHQLVRQAAERHFGHRLEFFEDFPYVQTERSQDFLQNSGQPNWQAEVSPVSDAALCARLEAVLAYKSQLSTFFTDRADLERQVFGYARRIGGERIWRQL